MKTAPLSRRDRLRDILADLRMPGALEALDAILRDVDGGTLTAPDAIEQLLMAQIQLRNNRRLQAAMRSSRLPAVKQLRDFDFTFQPSLRRDQIESLHELGFVERAMLFFQLMTRRYERASTVLTSNKGFEEWGEVFGDEVMAAALIDRLVHHCHLVTIRGNSYRMRQHTELWQTLHAAQEPEPASRRRRRQEVATA